MSNRLPLAQRDHLLNDKGPYRVMVVDQNSPSAETPDGSWDKPYKTIQAALNAIPTPVPNTVETFYGTTILIGTGYYDEDLNLPATGNIFLVAKGTVALGKSSLMTTIGVPGPVSLRSIVRVAGTSPMTLAPFGNIFSMQTLGRGQFYVSGDIRVEDAFQGNNQTLSLSGVHVAGSVIADSNVLAPVLATFYDCIVLGSVQVEGEVQQIHDCQFEGNFIVSPGNGGTGDIWNMVRTRVGGNLTISKYRQIVDCTIAGNVTLTGTDPGEGNWISRTDMHGTFSGPANSYRPDPMTEYLASLDPSFVLVPPATKVSMTLPLVAKQRTIFLPGAQFQPVIGAGSWVTSEQNGVPCITFTGATGSTYVLAAAIPMFESDGASDGGVAVDSLVIFYEVGNGQNLDDARVELHQFETGGTYPAAFVEAGTYAADHDTPAERGLGAPNPNPQAHRMVYTIDTPTTAAGQGRAVWLIFDMTTTPLAPYLRLRGVTVNLTVY